ncbi:MAG: T9SS type A sorting domain-containing protein [Candidatus Zixiibacteriota bacterium]|nr:MAG: T9SS type A sorting domain-containing protein [candidate division Zixibacteria bacterium]
MKRIFIVFVVSGMAVSSSATIINIPDDYPTIQAGIAYSSDGDTILVQPGLYYEIIDFMGHNVTVGSKFLITGDTSYISSTIIDGAASGPVITFTSGEDSSAVLTGFTIRNGYKDNGAGIRCMFGSSPTIKNNLVIDNNGYRYCGGIYCLNASNPIIRDNMIIANRCNLDGGGILSVRSSPRIINNIISENIADVGGGIFISDSSFAVIEGNIIIFNIAEGLGGGGIGAEGSHLVIKENVISGNSAGWEGGGIQGSNSSLVIIECMVSLNTSGADGGGIYLWYSDLFVKNTIIAGNTAMQFLGGGIFTYNSNPDIYNSIFYGNLSYGDGGGAYIAYSSADIINSIFLQNEAVWGGHQLGGHVDSLRLTYTNIEGGWPGVGNIDLDPLFRDPAGGDFHLMSVACGDSADSPCIDAGDPIILDSLLDCSWGLGGPRSDMGAYGGGDSAMVGIFNIPSSRPEGYLSLQNYPNPFNSETKIEFTIVNSTVVRLAVYDLLGREVLTLVDEYRHSGLYTATFEANDLSSGIYFCRLQVGEVVKTRPMVLLR